MIDKDIFELMARFNAGAATSFKLTTKEFTLELGKGGGAPAPASGGGAAGGSDALFPFPSGKYCAGQSVCELLRGKYLRHGV